MVNDTNNPAAAPSPRGRKVSLGLKARLLISIYAVLFSALAVSGYLFHRESTAQIRRQLAEESRGLARSLALVTPELIERRASPELDAIGRELLQADNVLLVCFLDAKLQPISIQSLDPTLQPSALPIADTTRLMRVETATIAGLGEQLTVVSPILVKPAAGSERLIGYVRIGMSMEPERRQTEMILKSLLLVGCLIMLAGIPMAYRIVRNTFHPIEELVAASRRAMNGELNISVMSGRNDAIGVLSRSFNEMMLRLRSKQAELAEANAQLATINTHLASTVESRTAELETANHRLVSEVAEKEDFLRAVSHDLNAPLRNIAGMVSLMLMKQADTLGTEVVERLNRIKHNVEIEADLINELLELSRIKTRRQRMEIVDPEKLIWELRGIFENDLRTRNIELRITSALPRLRAERARMRQVFQNLIDNAIKYMGDDSTERIISIGCQERAGEAEFHVRDTGIGIDPQDIDKVFYVFRRGRNVAPGVGGKGVGLASVRSIIQTYNGDIRVESELGRGTCFHFTINRAFLARANEQVGDEVTPEDHMSQAA